MLLLRHDYTNLRVVQVNIELIHPLVLIKDLGLIINPSLALAIARHIRFPFHVTRWRGGAAKQPARCPSLGSLVQTEFHPFTVSQRSIRHHSGKLLRLIGATQTTQEIIQCTAEQCMYKSQRPVGAY